MERKLQVQQATTRLIN